MGSLGTNAGRCCRLAILLDYNVRLFRSVGFMFQFEGTDPRSSFFRLTRTRISYFYVRFPPHFSRRPGQGFLDPDIILWQGQFGGRPDAHDVKTRNSSQTKTKRRRWPAVTALCFYNKMDNDSSTQLALLLVVR